MANNVVHTTAIRNGIADYVTAQIDTGGAGSLLIVTGSDTEVATLTFSATAFGDAAVGVCTANGITPDSSATGNASPVDAFIIKNGSATEIVRGTVGTSGSDINLSSLTIGAGDTVSISELLYTAPQ